MKAVVIGGTGHIGTYLVPRLVEAGFDVTSVSRGQRKPYLAHPAWRRVDQIALDRPALEAEGTFADAIAGLSPDVVVDMICYTEESASRLADALAGRIQHYVVIGTAWVHGHAEVVPTTESMPRRPFGEYGINKAAMEAYLLDCARRTGYPATIVHPGHIVGPGHVPVNPAGHKDLSVFETLSRGERLALPNLGMETLHHVHADDVAQVVMGAILNHSVAVGESLHAVSSGAITLRGYAEAVAGWFGQQANLAYLPLEGWSQTVSEPDAAMTMDHISHSPCCSIAKAQRLLGYAPRYTSLEAVYEALSWLIEHGDVDAPPLA